jgi:hypothetical protein
MMGPNIPTGNDEEYTDIVAENINKGKEPTYLEIEGIEISEYPSAGFAIKNTTILNKDVGDFLDALNGDISAFDIVIEHYFFEADWDKPAMIIFSGDSYGPTDYGIILKDMSEAIHTMKKLTRKEKLKALFVGIGDGRILDALHHMGCICYGCECNAVLLKEARDLLNRECEPWNFS